MVKKDVPSSRLKVFLRGARLLNEQEISQLPQEKRNAVMASEADGLWVEVDCPEGSCSLEGDKITLPAGGVSAEETKGIWLSMFCPDNECLFEQSTDVP